MRGSDHDAGKGLGIFDHPRNARGGAVILGQKDVEIIARQYFGGKLCRCVRLGSSVKTQNNFFLFWGMGCAPIAEGLNDLFYIGWNEILADKGAPSVGTEFDRCHEESPFDSAQGPGGPRAESRG